MPHTVETKITIMRPGLPDETRHAAVASVPGLLELRAIVNPHLDGGRLERVAVLHEGKQMDMFVDEMGQGKGLRRNDAATAIYRNNWLTQHPGTDPESLPDVVGPAVLFHRRVWF